AGYSITPLYSGRAPGLPGVDQINFTLPTTPPIPDGCSLLVQVQIGANVQTTAATIAKSSNDPVCHHPYALSTDQLSALQSGGTMKAAIALVERSHGIIAVANGQAFGTLTEKVAIQFRKFTANGSPIANQGYAFALSQAIGVCEVAQADPHGLDFIDFIDVNPAGSSPLDAGSTINLSGPGKSFDLAPGSLAKIVDGVDFPPVSTVQSALVDGNWMFSGAGGRDIGPFSAPFTLQNQFKLSFPTAITRGQPLTLAWSGGANSDADTVRIIMFGASLSGLNPTVICTAQAKAGTFTVPANLTSQLSNDAGAGALIAYSTVTSTRFTAPLVAGGALDSGAISVSVLEAYPTIPIH
ncbi:MAG TPA: hypothetical protein VGV35_13625, partial [Bryobacteraceae bacterium]|nr:hypothetical protein [Bryobacteraceae bacterium]